MGILKRVQQREVFTSKSDDDYIKYFGEIDLGGKNGNKSGHNPSLNTGLLADVLAKVPSESGCGGFCSSWSL